MIPNQEAILGVASCGVYVHRCLNFVSRIALMPGLDVGVIDRIVTDYAASCGLESATRGYRGYEFACCVSINDEVCHGFPKEKLTRIGDLVKIDVSFRRGEWYADSCTTSLVGPFNDPSYHSMFDMVGRTFPLELQSRHRLMMTAQDAVKRAILRSRTYSTFGDFLSDIDEFALKRGYSVVEDYGGHGIGKKLHDWEIDPVARIEPGQIFTIEPMLNEGEEEVVLSDDGWTVKTRDGSCSAQFEHTVAVMPDRSFLPLTGNFSRVREGLEAFGVDFKLREEI